MLFAFGGLFGRFDKVTVCTIKEIILTNKQLREIGTTGSFLHFATSNHKMCPNKEILLLLASIIIAIY